MALPEPSMEKGGKQRRGQRENGTNGEEHKRIKKPLL